MALTASVLAWDGPARADNVRDHQWYLKSLRVTEAQTLSKGAGVTIAVVDTGVYPHPDIRSNLLKGVDVVPGGHGDGQLDQAGHGTNMATTIAGHRESSSDGVLGIAPAAKILPVKITNRLKSMPATEMAKGIDWATLHGARVINVSAGTTPAFELQTAVRSAIRSDVVVIASVGNTSEVGLIPFPAAMDGVLTVGASGRSGKYDKLSLKDPKVQICAPGVDIVTAQPTDKYVETNGTSSSTAIVSGAAALVRAKFPQLSGPEVIHRLTATADDIGPPGRDDECGFGELNIVKALTADVPPLTGATPSATPTTNAAPIPGPRTTAAAPGRRSGSAAAVGWVVGILAVGALVGFLVVRLRRHS
jgi:type VII secretion-associated serine protease mycosin